MWTYLIDAFAGPGAAFMYAITAMAALAVAIVLERTYWLWLRWRTDLPTVLAALDRDEPASALGSAGPTPLGEVARIGLAEPDVDRSWEAMSGAAVQAEAAIRAHVPHLAAVGNLAVMLGLLGTIYGLMLAFSALGDAAAGEGAVRLSEGISTAMSTTAAGLIVGIFSLGAHAILEARVRAALGAIEVVAGRVCLHLRRQGP